MDIAVLFDVGGPLDMELAWEIAVDGAIVAACAAERISVDEARLAAASERAVAAFAADAYAAMIDDLSGGDPATAARVGQRVHAMVGGLDVFQLRPGIAGLLARLVGQGLKLGVVANQPADAVERMRRVAIAQYFTHFGLSGLVGVRKPDPEIFLDAVRALGVPPNRCIMVGDRIDNDIAPAKTVGMATIRFRAGRHARQRPRSPAETPDAEVVDVLELEAVIAKIIRERAYDQSNATGGVGSQL
jgi:putative hydrolase of the HAD superfamily